MIICLVETLPMRRRYQWILSWSNGCNLPNEKSVRIGQGRDREF